MRIPATPPDFNRFVTEVLPARQGKMMQIIRVKSTDERGRYLPWEKVRFLKPPDDLTPEEYWIGMKLARSGQEVATPFSGKDGLPFKFAEPDEVRRDLHAIDSSAGGNIGIEQPVITEATPDRHLVTSLIEEAFSSSVLEGAATTRQAAKEMVRGGRRPRDRDEQMVLNNYNAMRFIQDIKDLPLTTEIVLELHRIVTSDTLDDPSRAGRFRRPTDDITVADDITGEVYHVPPPAEELPDRVQAICDFAGASATDRDHRFVHPVLKAIILHFMIGYDHPFVDGNGRTARALFYWYMISHGYWLIEYVSISKIINKAPIKYGTAYLNTEIDDNDLTYFIIHQLQVVNESVIALHEYLSRKARELHAVENILSGTAYDGKFNHRQLKLIDHAISHPGERYTVQQHLSFHRVSYLTARKDLEALVNLKVLRKRKEWKTAIYTAPDDLADRLAKIEFNQ